MLGESTIIIYLNIHLKAILFYLTCSNSVYISLCMFREYTLHFDFLASEYSTVDKDCNILSLVFLSQQWGSDPKRDIWQNVSQFNNNFQGIPRLKKWYRTLNSVMYKHKTPQTEVSWKIRDHSFSLTRGELCHVLLGKATSLFLCLWRSGPITAFKFKAVLFFSICKLGVTASVGNHFKVLRTPAL